MVTNIICHHIMRTKKSEAKCEPVQISVCLITSLPMLCTLLSMNIKHKMMQYTLQSRTNRIRANFHSDELNKNNSPTKVISTSHYFRA